MVVKGAEGGGKRVIPSCPVEPEVADGYMGGNTWSDFENLREVVARDTSWSRQVKPQRLASSPKEGAEQRRYKSHCMSPVAF